MPASIASVFSEPDDFWTAMRVEGFQSLVIVGRGRFEARLTQVALGSFRVLFAEESRTMIAFIRVPDDKILILLPINGSPSPILGGLRSQKDELLTLSTGECIHARTDGPSRWGAIWLPDGQLNYYGRAVTGTAITVPNGVCCWRPKPGKLRQLRHLYAATIRGASLRSGLITGTEPAHGLEQQMILNLVESLSTGPVTSNRSMAHREREVMVRFEKLLQAGLERDLSATEICTALDVSDGFLRKCCNEHLGMNPGRYLNLLRMQSAHRALRNSGSGTLTVAKVVERFRFRNHSAFARAYFGLFGELPSMTLRRGPHGELAHAQLVAGGRLPNS
jgi:AraC-like DNA-binding protein